MHVYNINNIDILNDQCSLTSLRTKKLDISIQHKVLITEICKRIKGCQLNNFYENGTMYIGSTKN